MFEKGFAGNIGDPPPTPSRGRVAHATHYQNRPLIGGSSADRNRFLFQNLRTAKDLSRVKRVQQDVERPLFLDELLSIVGDILNQ